MDKPLVGISCGLFGTAFLLAIYGAGFSLRQVVVGALALAVAAVAIKAWKDAFPKPGFSRIQFKIDLNKIGNALLDAGISSREELEESVGKALESLPGGQIIFTWLEPGLFYMSAASAFLERPALRVGLKASGGRAKALENSWPDEIELRTGEDGYELVLIASEQRTSSRAYRTPGLVLFNFPYAFFAALQGKGAPWKRHEIAQQILGRNPDLKHWTYPEVSDAWGFTGKYGEFRWWYL